MERDTLVVENYPTEGASNVQETGQGTCCGTKMEGLRGINSGSLLCTI